MKRSLLFFSKKMEINNIFRNEIAKIIANYNQNSKQLVMSLRSSSEHCFQGTEYQKWWKYISYISTFQIIANLMVSKSRILCYRTCALCLFLNIY